MKRNPRKAKWTKAFRKAAGKELVVDNTFEFEKKRNIPVRYDRDLVTETVTAMESIQQIKSKREMKFYKQRMSNKKVYERNQAERELKQNIELLNDVTQRSLSKEQKIAVPSEKHMEIDC